MLVKKPTRRCSTRTQNPPILKSADRAGLNQPNHETEPSRVPQNLESLTNQASTTRTPPNTTQNLGLRFRALAKIDLNVNLENGMEANTISILEKDPQQETSDGSPVVCNKAKVSGQNEVIENSVGPPNTESEPPDKNPNTGPMREGAIQTTGHARGSPNQHISGAYLERLGEDQEDAGLKRQSYFLSFIMNNNNQVTESSVQEEMENHPIKIFVWNVQGARSSEFMNVLKEHIGIQQPTILALVETHITGSRAQFVCDRIGYGWCFHVEAQGFRGGIWVLWRSEDVGVNIIRHHDQYVTIEVNKQCYNPWLLTVVYASPHITLGETLWRELHQFDTQCTTPWLLVGDFNKMINLEERNHGGPEMQRRCTRFKH
ncbi:hypothetical protein Cgig2_013513 [Carnegiea gigantea]|uniref:Endonuclease/exonuclease/phosphatase domain-containing protein n=1 Tax=Carnegiea gigantea TaxID=171969 RepID=A0A9Q1JLY2_9CARY|nr:hypothetical protein Cgig2_013513 [Carnegiea gigantea]